MTEPPDLVAEYLRLVLGGVEFGDPGLVRLRGLMSPEEVSRVQELLLAEYVRTLPPELSAAMSEPRDFVGLYLALVARGAKPDDVRLGALAAAMTGEEFERCRASIGALWLEAEPSGRPN